MLKKRGILIGALILILGVFAVMRFGHLILQFIHDDKDEILSFATLVIAVFTATLWFATTGLYKMALKQSKDMEASLEISRKAVDATVQANNLNREIFLSTERPWIPVKIFPAGPLTYDINGLSINLSFHLRNVGKSPAKNVWVNFRFVAPKLGIENFDPVAVQKELSNQFRTAPSFLGHTIFPGEEIVLNISTNLSHEEIKKSTEKSNVLFPVVVGMAGYHFVFEEGQHQTGFIYDVRRKGLYAEISKTKNRSQYAIFPDEGDIPIEDIQLINYFSGGFFAD